MLQYGYRRKERIKMTVYELIKELIDYDPEAEIVFRGENDESFYEVNLRYYEYSHSKELEIKLY